MDAVKFLHERKRMFLSGDSSLIHLMDTVVDPEVLVRDVERWAAAHPRRTRQNVFLEQWPEAYIHKDGYLDICPLEVSAAHRDADGCCLTFGRPCPECRREFWTQEVE